MATNNPYLNREALLQILEHENEHEENEDLQRYYESVLPRLRKIALSYVDPLILQFISETLHSSFPYRSDWKVFAHKFGLNNSKIDSIAAGIITNDDLPLYTALAVHLQHINKNFGDIIRVLLDEERFDVLFKIKELVEIMLDNKNGNVPCDDEDDFQPSAPAYEIIEDNCENFELNLPLNICHKKDGEKFQANVDHENKLKSSPFTYKNTEEKINRSIMSPNNSIILTPTKKIIIPHAQVDYEIAQKFASFLNSKDFKVKLMSDLEGVFPFSENDAIQAILNYVDVVVLLLSKTFLQQILPHKFGSTSSQTPEALNNRLLYQFLQNEFKNNSSFNMRVRPVMVPEMDWNLIKDELLLCSAQHLSKDDTKIVNNLNTTFDLLFFLRRQNKSIKFA